MKTYSVRFDNQEENLEIWEMQRACFTSRDYKMIVENLFWFAEWSNCVTATVRCGDREVICFKCDSRKLFVTRPREDFMKVREAAAA